MTVPWLAGSRGCHCASKLDITFNTQCTKNRIKYKQLLIIYYCEHGNNIVCVRDIASIKVINEYIVCCCVLHAWQLVRAFAAHLGAWYHTQSRILTRLHTSVPEQITFTMLLRLYSICSFILLLLSTCKLLTRLTIVKWVISQSHLVQ